MLGRFGDPYRLRGNISTTSGAILLHIGRHHAFAHPLPPGERNPEPALAVYGSLSAVPSANGLLAASSAGSVGRIACNLPSSFLQRWLQPAVLSEVCEHLWLFAPCDTAQGDLRRSHCVMVSHNCSPFSLDENPCHSTGDAGSCHQRLAPSLNSLTSPSESRELTGPSDSGSSGARKQQDSGIVQLVFFLLAEVIGWRGLGAAASSEPRQACG